MPPRLPRAARSPSPTRPTSTPSTAAPGATGNPALVVQPTSGTFLAFDAVCRHAGCTVEYSQLAGIFVCPCHGSEFNGRTGAVETGPAGSDLTRIAIAQGPDGNLHAR